MSDENWCRYQEQIFVNVPVIVAVRDGACKRACSGRIKTVADLSLTLFAGKVAFSSFDFQITERSFRIFAFTDRNNIGGDKV